MHRGYVSSVGCLTQQLRCPRQITGMVGVDRVERPQIVCGQRIMQLQACFKPSFSKNLVLFHPDSEVVEDSEIGAGGSVALYKRFVQQAHGEIFILSDTK